MNPSEDILVSKLQREGLDVRSDPELLKTYTKTQAFVQGFLPHCVVFARSREDVVRTIMIANEMKVPVVPRSSPLSVYGEGIPREGGAIVLDLSRMVNLEVNEDDWIAVIEPGVTYERLLSEAKERGLRCMVPLGAHRLKSVLTSYLEGDPSLSATSFEFGNDLITNLEVVLPTGEIIKTGSWSLEGGRPGGQWGPVQKDVFRLWMGAQGTLGIVTRMAIKLWWLPKVRKVFFMGFDSVEEALEAMRRTQRMELGMECFLLNDFNMAALLTKEWTPPEDLPCERIPSASFHSLKKKIPEWVLVIISEGWPYFPEDKVGQEESDLLDLCRGLHVEILTELRGVRGAAGEVGMLVEKPWLALKKARYKGSFHTLRFYTSASKVRTFEDLIKDMAHAYDYPLTDIGGYVLSIERGRSVYCEFDLHCDLSNEEEKARVRELWLRLNEALASEGAYLAKLYGPLADILLSKVGMYATKLKDLKKELDPNNVLNPGVF